MEFHFEEERFVFTAGGPWERRFYRGTYTLPCGKILDVERVRDLRIEIDKAGREETIRGRFIYLLSVAARKEAQRLSAHRALKWVAHYGHQAPVQETEWPALPTWR